MSKSERLPALITAAATFTVALLIAIFQFRSGLTAVPGSPVEVGETAFTFAVALVASGIAAIMLHATAKQVALWTGLSVALWLWFAAAANGIDDVLADRFTGDRFGTALAWCITAAAIIPALRNSRLLASSRIFLGVGLLLQSMAFFLDFGRGGLFHFAALEDHFSNFYLAAYLAGLLLIAMSLPFGRPGAAMPLLSRISELSPARAIGIGWSALAWPMWRIAHPTASYADFYAARISRKLDKGQAHRTLGRFLFTHDAFAPQDQNREISFDKEGRNYFEQILSYGLTEPATVVDYGCGSLRVGQHFIRYLRPGAYWGLDITERFYHDGLSLLPGDLVADKRPNLRLINLHGIAEARAAHPDAVFSIAVLKHVPFAEMEQYWRNIADLMTVSSFAFITCDVASKTVRTSSMNWAYTERQLKEAIGLALPGRDVHFTFSGGMKHFGNTPFQRATIYIGPYRPSAN